MVWSSSTPRYSSRDVRDWSHLREVTRTERKGRRTKPVNRKRGEESTAPVSWLYPSGRGAQLYSLLAVSKVPRNWLLAAVSCPSPNAYAARRRESLSKPSVTHTHTAAAAFACRYSKCRPTTTRTRPSSPARSSGGSFDSHRAGEFHFSPPRPSSRADYLIIIHFFLDPPKGYYRVLR